MWQRLAFMKVCVQQWTFESLSFLNSFGIITTTTASYINSSVRFPNLTRAYDNNGRCPRQKFVFCILQLLLVCIYASHNARTLRPRWTAPTCIRICFQHASTCRPMDKINEQLCKERISIHAYHCTPDLIVNKKLHTVALQTA